jgi:hypothetical protein
MRALRVLAAALLAPVFALRGGPAAAEDPPWRARAENVGVRYSIDAQLVETVFGDGVRIVGNEQVFWKNTSREAVKVLYFHTYANAFRNTRSTFLREAARDTFELPDDMRWGDMTVQTVTTIDGTVLKPSWASPDDANPDDRTVLKVELPAAVEPAGEIALKIAFTLEMPRVTRRMGASHGFVMAAQWYPKLGMFLGHDSKVKGVNADGWFCHQYHANCEFAADFADYDVKLTFPPQFKVGATGTPQGPDETEPRSGSTQRRYRAESVVDFAWTASPEFVEIAEDVTPVVPDRLEDPVSNEWRRVTQLLGLPADESVLPPVRVVLLVQPEHRDQAPRMFEAARTALGLFGTWLGPYPYGRLTIVDPPWNGDAAGGMEYPMLVTGGTVENSPPESQRPEHVIVHEIGHQWLMGLLANNEVVEAWLDEGINTYLTAHAMHLRYGPGQVMTDILGFHFPYTPVYDFGGISSGWPEALDLPKWARPPKIDALKIWRDLPHLSYVPAKRYGSDPMIEFRRRWLRRAGQDEMVKAGWEYADRTSYGVNAYSRPVLFLNTLRRGLAAEHGADEGERRFIRALRGYAREFRFRHPTTDDFLRKWKELAADAGPAADQLVRTADVFDYSIASVRTDEEPKFVGIDDKSVLHKEEKPAETLPGVPEPAKPSVVRVQRRGGARVPVVLEVTLKDGRTERRRWETADQVRDAWKDFRFGAEVVAARLDPDGVYLQDLSRSGDLWSSESNARPAVKWSVRFVNWLENSLLSYGRFF